MSWSVSGIGRPAAVKAFIAKTIEGYGPASPTNQSRREFEDAAPHLTGLIDQIVGASAVVKFAASGHATFVDGVKTSGTVSVAIETVYGFVE